jgi:hypothetical protein
MDVKIVDYGFSEEFQSYYVTYKIIGMDEESLNKLKERVDDPTEIKCGEMYLTTYFEEEYFPFRSQEAKTKPDDFIAREEIEMVAYLTDLLED